MRSDSLLWAATRVLAQLSFLATAFILLSRTWWFFDLFANFRIQLLSVQMLLLAIVLVLRRPVWAVALGAVSILNGTAVRDYILPVNRDYSSANVAVDYRVLTANVNASNRSPEALIALVESGEPDIFAVLELTEDYAEELSILRDLYPHQLLAPESGNFGIGVYSRMPFSDANVIAFGGFAAIDVALSGTQRPWHLIAVHTMPPIGAAQAELRNQQLVSVAEYVNALAADYVVVGDLNITPFSPHFSDFIETAGLRDALRGQGFAYTWPSFFPLLGIPIDYVLVNNSFDTINYIRGGDVGSDHFPVFADINWNRNRLD